MLEAPAGDALGVLVRQGTEEAKRMSGGELRAACIAYRTLAQVFEDEADLRLG